MPPVIPRALGHAPQVTQMPMAGGGLRAPQGALGGAQAGYTPQPYVDPYADQYDAIQKQMDALGNEGAIYSAEEARRRQEQNDIDYRMALLAQLSGSEQLQGVGGQVLKQAMADRQQKVSDKGVFDPLNGKWTYSPEYKRERLEGKLDRLGTLRAGHRAAYDKADEDRRWREFNREDTQAFLRSQAGARGEPLVAVMVPGGGTQLVPRSQAVGMQPAPAGSGQPTGEERKAATLLKRLRFSQTQLQQAVTDDPRAAVATQTNKLIGKVPGVGEDAANYLQSPARQRVEAAQLDLLDAALTLGTGAAYTREQLVGYARSYFPQPHDDAATRTDKAARLANVIEAAEIAAGRAGPAAQAPRAGGGATGSWEAPGAAPAGGGQPRVKVKF